MDKEWLERVVAARPKYVGMLGSRHKVSRIFEELRGKGVPAGLLEKVHAPVGLDIGAVTPEEIAVSIVAQLVQQSKNRALEQ
jgi:xanthine dehydrogenase accessory factor